MLAQLRIGEFGSRGLNRRLALGSVSAGGTSCIVLVRYHQLCSLQGHASELVVTRPKLLENIPCSCITLLRLFPYLL